MGPATSTRRYYPGIALYKVCGAILVALAHIAPFWQHLGMSDAQMLTCLAPFYVVVPCFYIISGFLVSKGWTRSAAPRRYIRSYIIRIGAIYVALVLLYIAKDVLPGLATGGASLDHVVEALKRIVIDFVLGPEAFLWFVPPLLFGLAVMYWLTAKNLLKKATPFLVGGFLLSMCVGGSLRLACAHIPGFSELLAAKGMYYVASVLTKYVGYGLTFVAVGVWIASHESRFMRIRVGWLGVACVAVTAGEFVLLNYGGLWDAVVPLCFCFVPISLLLFRGMLAWERSGDAWNQRFWNILSALTYFGHHPLLEVSLLLMGMNVSAASQGAYQDSLMFIAVIVECFACTMVLMHWMTRPLGRTVRSPGW